MHIYTLYVVHNTLTHVIDIVMMNILTQIFSFSNLIALINWSYYQHIKGGVVNVKVTRAQLAVCQLRQHHSQEGQLSEQTALKEDVLNVG